VEKDPDTIVPIVNGLVRFWPWTNAAKQMLFLNELEEVLELCRVEQLAQVRCLSLLHMVGYCVLYVCLYVCM